MKGSLKALTLLVGLLCLSSAAFGQVKRFPDGAFDTDRNRYLMVWEEADGGGTVIKAQFRNPDGSVGAGAPVLISDPRGTQGCFYGQFDEQNGDISTPTDCSQNKNPSVAYNNGRYLISWEVHGTAAAPSSAPDNQFINIFAQIVDAQTLDPLPGWEEGILISKVFIAANNAESQCGDKHACNDGQIQAWSKSKNPDVTPQLGGPGFIVTWQTNKDFIGCADSERRGGWAVYGRYIDQNFSSTSTTNPPAFAVFKDDSTVTDSCEPLSNVDNGANPRIAVNQTSTDFVIVYEVARANGGNANIGAKRVTLGPDNVGQVTGSLMPDIVASVGGSSLNNPEVVSFKNQYVLFASDGSNIRTKNFASDSINSSEPNTLSLGSGSKINPRAATNLGIGGQRGGGSNPSPERILLAFEKSGDIFAATLNEGLEVTRSPQNISSGSSENQFVEIASDVHNFLGVWQGNDSGQTVFAEFISSEDGALPTPTPNVPPTAPGLLTPSNGTTFAPTRALLSWNLSTDLDGDAITYRIYFGETLLPATPQVSGITETEFIIGPETFTTTGITLQPNKVYQWKIEADDGQGGLTSSPVRTINTDDSVVAWWRFDEDIAGPVCAGGVAGETACDSSGKNNHGSPFGMPAWLPPPIVGALDGIVQFSAADERIDVANDATLNPDNISIFISFNENAGVTTQTQLVDKRDGAAGAGYDLRIQGASSPRSLTWIVTDQTLSEQAVVLAASVPSSTWKQFLVVYDSPLKRLSIFDSTGIPNHQLIGVTFNRTMKATSPLRIGSTAFSPGTSLYNGRIDEIIVMNKSSHSDVISNFFAPY